MPIIQAVDRALLILDLFNEYETELKITEISERMNLHKSTVHSLLKTLQKHHYIEQNLENGKYKLGMKLFERGNFVIQNIDIRTMAREYLVELSKETGQTVHLVILDGQEGVYIDKVESSSATVLYSRIGRRIPIHCSAVGKVLVAFKSKEELEKILVDYSFKAHTENTITDEADFIEELRQVQINGYAIDDEENERGVYCVALPIYDHTKQVVAAISVSVPVSQLKKVQLTSHIQLLKDAASHLSKKLGYVI